CHRSDVSSSCQPPPWRRLVWFLSAARSAAPRTPPRTPAWPPAPRPAPRPARSPAPTPLRPRPFRLRWSFA
ncbi:MAG: hypothetical protein AVDCRST_MAG19-1994, partial [uncultured Thermomicrobiales bacterium]